MSNNSNNSQIVVFDAIRTLGEADIADTYAPVGTPTTFFGRIVIFTNTTEGDMYFSTDGVNDQIVVPAGTSKILEFNTNRANRDQWWCAAVNTQFYVRYIGAPMSGAVYIEVMGGD